MLRYCIIDGTVITVICLFDYASYDNKKKTVIVKLQQQVDTRYCNNSS